MKRQFRIKILLFLSLCIVTSEVFSRSLNGFNLDKSLIPNEEILQGGPPKDGIPALDNPKFLAASDAKYLNDNDYVLGINLNGKSKAYPIRILNWHEVVNDHIGEFQFVVTYCPLCGSGMVFEAKVNNINLKFGVSGLLYNSDVLLYDKESLSLWSQIKSQAISGKFRGVQLKNIPIQQTTWRDWREKHPDTKVLSVDTSYQRDYATNPYAGYQNSNQLYFPVKFRAKGYHPKEQVIALALNGHAKAWPFVELGKSNGLVKDKFAGKTIAVKFNKKNRSAIVVDETGRLLPATTLYWFAWYAFYPETAVYSAD